MEDIENKSLKNFILSNKKNINFINGFVIIILANIFLVVRFNAKKENRYKNSEDFINCKSFLSQNNDQKSLEILKKIISKMMKFIHLYHYFLIIDKDLEKNRENVLKYFDQIISINSLEKEDLNLLKLKKAIYISDSADETDLLKMLNPILNSRLCLEV